MNIDLFLSKISFISFIVFKWRCLWKKKIIERQKVNTSQRNLRFDEIFYEFFPVYDLGSRNDDLFS